MMHKNSINAKTDVSKRIGIAKGAFTVNGDFDIDNADIADQLTEGMLFPIESKPLPYSQDLSLSPFTSHAFPACAAMGSSEWESE